MMRLWCRLWKDTHMLKDTVVCREEKDTRTHKIFAALEEACCRFDLCRPIWLEKNIAEFQSVSKTSFYQDSFIEEIPFDYMEIQVIEEDD